MLLEGTMDLIIIIIIISHKDKFTFMEVSSHSKWCLRMNEEPRIRFGDRTISYPSLVTSKLHVLLPGWVIFLDYFFRSLLFLASHSVTFLTLRGAKKSSSKEQKFYRSNIFVTLHNTYTLYNNFNRQIGTNANNVFFCRLPWYSCSFAFLACIQPYCVRNKIKIIPKKTEVFERVPVRLRPRIFFDVLYYEGGRSSAIGTGRLYPRINPCYSLSESESTPGHTVPSGATEKNPQWHHRISIPGPSD